MKHSKRSLEWQPSIKTALVYLGLLLLSVAIWLLAFLVMGWLFCANASAHEPGFRKQGQCLTFALAYCVDHFGSELVIVTYPSAGKLHAHVLVYDHGTILDNMHPMGVKAHSNDAIAWLCQLGEEAEGASVFRVIQYNQQSLEDIETINYLKRTE